MSQNNCPCGNKIPFTQCCKPIIEGRKTAQNAEELMRSRYTAFTLANGDYLMKSHHPKTRKSSDKQNIETWAKSVNWIRLEVLNTTNGHLNDDSGTVEFKAYFYVNGAIDTIHENSYFLKEGLYWMYVGKAS